MFQKYCVNHKVLCSRCIKSAAVSSLPDTRGKRDRAFLVQRSVIGAAVLEMDWGRTVRKISIRSEAQSGSMISLPLLIPRSRARIYLKAHCDSQPHTYLRTPQYNHHWFKWKKLCWDGETDKERCWACWILSIPFQETNIFTRALADTLICSVAKRESLVCMLQIRAYKNKS